MNFSLANMPASSKAKPLPDAHELARRLTQKIFEHRARGRHRPQVEVHLQFDELHSIIETVINSTRARS